MPTGLAGEQQQRTHSGNNSQSICALDRYTDLFKYCPQPLLYFSVSIIIRSLPCFAHLTSKCFLPRLRFYCFMFITHLSIHCITPSPCNIFLILPFIPPPLTIIFLLFICSPSPQSSGVSCQDARKLWFTYLCLCPLAKMVELRQRAQQGLCQCRKLVCHQDAWMHILTEYWTSVCGVTYKTCTVWCLVRVFHTSCTLYSVMLSYTELICTVSYIWINDNVFQMTVTLFE